MRRELAKLIFRRYPFYSGYSRVFSSPLYRWFEKPAAPGQVVQTRIRGGTRIEVRLDDLEGRCIDMLGEWDPRITWICRRVLRRGDTLVDVGANFGLISLVGAQVVGPTGRVHAFEPQPGLAGMLRRSVCLNGLENITVHEIALSDRDGDMVLHVPSDHSGAASLNGERAGLASSALPVRVRRGGDYFEEKHIGPIRLLKIDVEGHEAQVLEGLEPVFRDRPPAAVVFESNDWFEGIARGIPAAAWPFAELPTVRFLRNHGYRFYALGRSYLRVNLYFIDADVNEHPPVADVLAIHQARADEIGRALRISTV